MRDETFIDREWIKIIDETPQICQYFVSLEGEGNAIGEQSLYLRLAYCSAKCKFCDTKFSWNRKPSNPTIFDQELTNQLRAITQSRSIRRMTITGGEPLASIKYIPMIIEHINAAVLENSKLTHLGIESNGAHAALKSNIMDILKVFNHIKKSYGIKITLTISPKLERDVSWYHTKMDQNDIDRLYFKTFSNLENYINGTHNVNYKFVYDYTNTVIDFDHTSKFIKYLFELGAPRRKILLMPLTPDKPLTDHKEVWEQSKHKTALKALELGVRYSPRLHVDLGLD